MRSNFVMALNNNTRSSEIQRRIRWQTNVPEKHSNNTFNAKMTQVTPTRALFYRLYAPSFTQLLRVLECSRHFFKPYSNKTGHNKHPYAVVSTLQNFNPLNPELNPICYLLALLGAHHFLHVSRIRVKFTFRLLMSYIYGAPILDVSRSHTTTQHSR